MSLVIVTRVVVPFRDDHPGRVHTIEGAIIEANKETALSLVRASPPGPATVRCANTMKEADLWESNGRDGAATALRTIEA